MDNNELKENYLTNELCDELYEMCAKSSDVPESFLKPEFKNTDSVVVEMNKWLSAFSDLVFTLPEEMRVMEFNEFIRKINDPEQIAFSYKYLEIKKQFLASHKFNNARNKIKLTNKYLYSKYLQIVMLTQRMNKFIANMKEYFN